MKDDVWLVCGEHIGACLTISTDIAVDLAVVNAVDFCDGGLAGIRPATSDELLDVCSLQEKLDEVLTNESATTSDKNFQRNVPFDREYSMNALTFAFLASVGSLSSVPVSSNISKVPIRSENS